MKTTARRWITTKILPASAAVLGALLMLAPVADAKVKRVKPLAAATPGHVRGTVMARGGRVVNHARVRITRMTGLHHTSRVVRTGAAGHFNSRHNPGLYKVFAWKPGVGRSATVRVAVAPGQAVAAPLLYLHRARGVTHLHRFILGTAHHHTTDPVAAAAAAQQQAAKLESKVAGGAGAGAGPQSVAKPAPHVNSSPKKAK